MAMITEDREVHYRRVYVRDGVTYRKKMPFSEAMMHCRLCGTEMNVRKREGTWIADLVNENGSLGGAFTCGEVGFFWNEQRRQHYFVIESVVRTK